jgi:hypothetical protein
MKARAARRGQRVRVTKTGTVAAAGELGTIHECRGWNYWHGEVISRFLMVWIDTMPDGRPTRRVVSISSNEVEREPVER